MARYIRRSRPRTVLTTLAGHRPLLTDHKSPPDRRVWLSLAVKSRQSGRWHTMLNLGGRPRTTANGFEDRALGVHHRPVLCTQDQDSGVGVRQCSSKDAQVLTNGCQLGCQNRNREVTHDPEPAYRCVLLCPLVSCTSPVLDTHALCPLVSSCILLVPRMRDTYFQCLHA